MTLNSWQQLSKLKANLVELVDVLISDDVISRKEIAFDLLANIETLNGVESDLVKFIRNNQMRKLFDECQEKELSREKERASTDQ